MPNIRHLRRLETMYLEGKDPSIAYAMAMIGAFVHQTSMNEANDKERDTMLKIILKYPKVVKSYEILSSDLTH